MWRPPRSCNDYWSEYKHCRSLRHRFHHYYTFGTQPRCSQWKDDYYMCREWEKRQSTEAKVSLQESEKAREAERNKFDPVWELRQKPPADWYKPLKQNEPQGASQESQ